MKHQTTTELKGLYNLLGVKLRVLRKMDNTLVEERNTVNKRIKIRKELITRGVELP